MARRYHPDANRDADTTKKFQDVNSAYQALIDPRRKKMYDEFREATKAKTRAKSRDAARSERNAPADSESPFRRYRGFGRDDVDLGARDESDAFARGRTARGGGSGPARRERSSVESPHPSLLGLEIDPRTAALGGEREIEFSSLETCRSCRGTGEASKRCEACGGSGSSVQADWSGMEHVGKCAKCRGKGRITERCGACAGRGRTEETTSVRVAVPPGVRDGDVLRVDSSSPTGGGGGGGGPRPEDLHVLLRVIGGEDSAAGEEERADDDVRIDLNVDPRTAANGGDATVRYARLETCDACGGSGRKPADLCRACHGSGITGFAERSLQYDFRNEPRECAECGGTGLRSDAETCGTCAGKGRILTAEEVVVTVPPGAADGDSVRVAGAGDAGRRDGGDPAGDLHVFFKIERKDVRAKEETE